VLATWKRHGPRVTPTALDTLHRAVDAIRGLVENSAASDARDDGPNSALLAELARLESAPPPRLPSATARAGGPGERDAVSHSAPEADRTVRVATERVERVLYASEELLSMKSAQAQRSGELRELLTLLEQWRREWTLAQPVLLELRQRAARARGTDDGRECDAASVAELVNQSDLVNRTLTEKLDALARAFERDRHASGKLIDSLLEETKELLLLPLESEAAFFSKVVRDLARDQGKDVELVVRGGEVEVDKRVLQELKDPLVHLLRNCIDHGLEQPDQRVRVGKPARGTITLTAAPIEDHHVEIVIEDDGAGIDFERVRHAALRRGVVKEDALARLTRDETLALIFRAEVSTAPIVTEISGRGVGLAIVAERVEKLGGRVQVRTEPNRGTSFHLRLPIAQSTFRGILVSAAERLFVLPATRVERVQRTPVAELKTVENRDTVLVDQRPVAFVWLADALELPGAKAPEPTARFIELVVIGSAERRVAFGVDAIVREEEVLVKPLRKPLRRVRNIAGATVLGSGDVVPILNVADLLKSAVILGGRPATARAATKPVPTRHTILVAEDSITSRMLLKNILESAGYLVKTAVDGLDALTTLRSERVNLVVSDVEMPRLNGFALTAAIRADRRLAELPVILVTALATREDRERGIDAGANAYLVKSDFEQSNLLEIVQRFV
jgi:two-component system chemotaxis sensor kinase CheA